MKIILAIVAILIIMSTPAFADTSCATYPNDEGNLPTAALRKQGVNASVQIVVVNGTPSFSVQFQESNIGGSSDNWENSGAAITSTGLTKFVDANAEYVRAGVIKVPAAPNSIKVCVYGDNPAN